MTELEKASAEVETLTATLAEIDRQLAALRNRRLDATCDRDIARRRLGALQERAKRDQELVSV